MDQRQPDPMEGVFRWSWHRSRRRLGGVIGGGLLIPVLAGIVGQLWAGVAAAAMGFVLALLLVFGVGLLLGFCEQRDALRRQVRAHDAEQATAEDRQRHLRESP